MCNLSCHRRPFRLPALHRAAWAAFALVGGLLAGSSLAQPLSLQLDLPRRSYGMAVPPGQALAQRPGRFGAAEAPLTDTPGLGPPEPQRVGLLLTVSDLAANLKRGMLHKLEISGHTTLALRPRGGRLGVALHSQW